MSCYICYLMKMPQATSSYGATRGGITLSDVSQSADSLLRAGLRPTTRRVREKIGRGAPNTIGPLLDSWWKSLASRLDAGPAALHRIPESVAHAAEALWMQALEESRRRTLLEQRQKEQSIAHDQERLALRGHVLTLREGELDARLRERDKAITELGEQVRSLMTMLRREQASHESALRRVRALEADLAAARHPVPPSTPRRVRAAPVVRKRTSRRTPFPVR